MSKPILQIILALVVAAYAFEVWINFGLRNVNNTVAGACFKPSGPVPKVQASFWIDTSKPMSRGVMRGR